MKDELKRCPFCGGKASMNLNGNFYWIACLKCLAEVEGSYSKIESIERWNRRVSDDE